MRRGGSPDGRRQGGETGAVRGGTSLLASQAGTAENLAGAGGRRAASTSRAGAGARVTGGEERRF